MNLLSYKGDLFGGLTAAVVALPLALAFGVSSGIGPIAGLYGAVFVGFFAAWFGGTPSQVSGPTGPMTVVMALIVADFATMFPDNPSYVLSLSFTVVMMGGIIQASFGFLKIGRYVNLIPTPVISGFMTGIGVIIILLQLAPFSGNESVSKPISAVLSIPEFLSNLNSASLVLGGLTLLIVYATPKSVNRILPSPLIALIVGTLVSLLVFGQGATPILGEIPSGLPAMVKPAFDLNVFVFMVKSAVILAVLGSLDSLLTSLVADNLTRTHHNSDKELIGQGIGNAVAGLFGGLPGAGATMRTVVNIRAGGQTRISGMVHATILLIVVLGAGGVAENIPNAVLAGILIKVGTDIIDWGYLRRIPVAPKAGVIMMFTVLVLTVFVDLITAVGVGVVMASLVFLQRMTDLQLSSIATSQEPDSSLKLNANEKDILATHEKDILLFNFGGPITFGAAKGIVQKFSRLSKYKVLVLDFSDVTLLDFSASMAVSDIISQATQSDKRVILTGASEKIGAVMKRLGVLDNVPAEQVIADREAALKLAVTQL